MEGAYNPSQATQQAYINCIKHKETCMLFLAGVVTGIVLTIGVIGLIARSMYET